MEVMVTIAAIRRAKLQSNHHQQQTNTQIFTRGAQTDSVKALKGKYLFIYRTSWKWE